MCDKPKIVEKQILPGEMISEKDQVRPTEEPESEIKRNSEQEPPTHLNTDEEPLEISEDPKDLPEPM